MEIITSADRQFVSYHEDNPQIYTAFKRLAFKAMSRGKQYYGAKALFEVLRWQTEIEGTGEFKINNNHVSRYVRLFETEFPEHRGFFRKRILKS